jgi:hypothetical protein
MAQDMTHDTSQTGQSEVRLAESMKIFNVNRKMVGLGTDHSLQGLEKLPQSKKIDNPTYGVLVAKLVRDFSVDYIFEEATNFGPSTASKLEATSLGYLDVDPPGNEYHLHGIPPSLPIEDYVIYEPRDPRKPKPEPYATQKNVATVLGRERVWIERITSASFTNGLLICGTAHAFSVASRLGVSGFSVDVIIYRKQSL